MKNTLNQFITRLNLTNACIDKAKKRLARRYNIVTINLAAPCAYGDTVVAAISIEMVMMRTGYRDVYYGFHGINFMVNDAHPRITIAKAIKDLRKNYRATKPL